MRTKRCARARRMRAASSRFSTWRIGASDSLARPMLALFPSRSPCGETYPGVIHAWSVERDAASVAGAFRRISLTTSLGMKERIS
jgi:hypothetical protein